MTTRVERILILAKTYPSPSAKHAETSCVAGINDRGEARQLYPVPFRIISGDQQFQKWQWIDVRVEKSSADHRPESHKIYVDTIQVRERIPTKEKWCTRRLWWEKLPLYDSFELMDGERSGRGMSLAILRPKRLVRLEIVSVSEPDWTEEEMAKLLQEQSQGNLFSRVRLPDQAVPLAYHQPVHRPLARIDSEPDSAAGRCRQRGAASRGKRL